MLTPQNSMRDPLPPGNRIANIQLWAPSTTANLPYRYKRGVQQTSYGNLTERGFTNLLRHPTAENNPRATTAPRLGPTEELFSKLLNFWQLDQRAGAILLGYGPQGISRIDPILNGVTYLTTRDEKDRIAELFRIRKLLRALFRDRDTENSWLREPNKALENRAPLDLLLEGSMENVLRVRQFVETIAGL